MEWTRSVSDVDQTNLTPAVLTSQTGHLTWGMDTIGIRRVPDLRKASPPPLYPPRPLYQVAWTVEEPRAVYATSCQFSPDPRSVSDMDPGSSIVVSTVM